MNEEYSDFVVGIVVVGVMVTADEATVGPLDVVELTATVTVVVGVVWIVVNVVVVVGVVVVK